MTTNSYMPNTDNDKADLLDHLAHTPICRTIGH